MRGGSVGRLAWLRRRCGLLVAATAIVASLTLTQTAFADTAPIATSPDTAAALASHRTPLELLAGQIASHIAGRAVSVHCESDADWAVLVGADAKAESGYVATAWNDVTGQLISSSSVAELADNVCQPLKAFAEAMTKPTKCAPGTVGAQTAARTTATAAKHKAIKTARRAGAATGPCYLSDGTAAARMPLAFWAAYSNYAVAILTLAHESVHLSGVVGGQLANGLAVGDQQAEAKADCYGMQWMPYVAQQLGDSPDDAHAVADYFWNTVYPQAKSAAYANYWSAECHPGGALDLHPAQATNWP